MLQAIANPGLAVISSLPFALAHALNLHLHFDLDYAEMPACMHVHACLDASCYFVIPTTIFSEPGPDISAVQRLRWKISQGSTGMLM